MTMRDLPQHTRTLTSKSRLTAESWNHYHITAIKFANQPSSLQVTRGMADDGRLYFIERLDGFGNLVSSTTCTSITQVKREIS